MDLLDFEVGELYYDEPIKPAAEAAIQQAADHYGQEQAELALLRAYFLEPEHPLVLVALYRYFYYEHRLAEALEVSERVLRLTARRLGFSADWRSLGVADISGLNGASLTLLRFYLLALKGAGYLELRLGRLDAGLVRLQKVVALDDRDRLGTKALIEVALVAIKDTRPHQAVQSE